MSQWHGAHAVTDLDTFSAAPYRARDFSVSVIGTRLLGGTCTGFAPMSKSPFDDLESRLVVARAREKQEGDVRKRSPRRSMKGLAMGMRLTVEFASGIAIGTGIGWGLDLWLGSRPWLMVVFLFLGGAAGVMNAYRAAKGMDETVGFGQAQQRQHDAQQRGAHPEDK